MTRETAFALVGVCCTCSQRSCTTVCVCDVIGHDTTRTLSHKRQSHQRVSWSSRNCCNLQVICDMRGRRNRSQGKQYMYIGLSPADGSSVKLFCFAVKGLLLAIPIVFIVTPHPCRLGEGSFPSAGDLPKAHVGSPDSLFRPAYPGVKMAQSSIYIFT